MDKLTAIVLSIAILITGCQCTLNPADSPSEIVKKFVSCPNLRYHLMSSEFRESTTEESFEKKIDNCYSSWTYYEFKEIKNEKINGDTGIVEITYLKKYKEHGFPTIPIVEPEEKIKKIKLIKEKDGWRILSVHCELVGKQ